VTVATNWEAPITRSLPNVPILFIPIFAWLGRTRPEPLYRSFQAMIGRSRIGTSWKE
jgi:hypothetical protein